ncbi:MAG TPA: NAD(P)-dependent oxidoreductase [Actinophytocola sp.]|uniref:NAD-dependent epimerase/dehydratase family protein n=1 Tax=Actinophytocola sp. TaxID=1872138 RepID=UPI002DDD3CCF|nr:NAD(P)-dependent oxidoreductase [Actinophytocola sp.]HEV2782527.1 NAD(P)-dependent oxidoreductase [Actinophytocola sp.]
MTTICVTGASGRLGRFAVTELLGHGYEVVATDVRAPERDIGAPVLRADLTDYGQAVEVLQDVDAVVHLANIPAPDIYPPVTTFTANTTMNHNVFHAATRLGLRRVVWASSETTLGLPFDTPPRYAPVDEDHYPLPTTSYALSKVVTETMAEHFAAWSGVPFVALRFSNILGPTEYQRFPEFWSDPTTRRWNLWGYIDQRDAATACRLALEADVTASSSHIIAAADTVMDRPSVDLLREVYPDTALKRDVGEHETLLSIDRARRVLGFNPEHSWRQYLS